MINERQLIAEHVLGAYNVKRLPTMTLKGGHCGILGETMKITQFTQGLKFIEIDQCLLSAGTSAKCEAKHDVKRWKSG